jgi:hypothetical protein
MKVRGLLIGLLLTLIAVYGLFFMKVADHKGGLRIEVDKYLESKIKLTAANMEGLSRVILAHADEGEGLPASLDALRRLEPSASSAADAWGRKLRYERLSDESFRLTSSGPDGVLGTADDIVKDF